MHSVGSGIHRLTPLQILPPGAGVLSGLLWLFLYRIRKGIGILLFRTVEASEILFDQDPQAGLIIDRLLAFYTNLVC